MRRDSFGAWLVPDNKNILVHTKGQELEFNILCKAALTFSVGRCFAAGTWIWWLCEPFPGFGGGEEGERITFYSCLFGLRAKGGKRFWLQSGRTVFHMMEVLDLVALGHHPQFSRKWCLLLICRRLSSTRMSASASIGIQSIFANTLGLGSTPIFSEPMINYHAVLFHSPNIYIPHLAIWPIAGKEHFSTQTSVRRWSRRCSDRNLLGGFNSDDGFVLIWEDGDWRKRYWRKNKQRMCGAKRGKLDEINKTGKLRAEGKGERQAETS